MKKICCTLLFNFCCLLLYPQYVTLKGKQLYDSSGNQFLVKGVNYGVDLYSSSATPGGIDLTQVQIRRYHGYYQNSQYPIGYTYAQYLNDISADFKFIHDSLGCNTIRLGVTVGGADGCDSDTFKVSINYNPSKPPNIFGYQAKVPCTSMAFIDSVYAQLLDTAAAYDLKVVLLLLGTGASCDTNTYLQNFYANYLASTARACKHKKALVAYDEWNEPQISNLGYIENKAQVCSKTKMWYDTLKLNDPNHLVTVGLWAGGFGPDASNWSTDVYKADFYAFHVYPDESYLTHTEYQYWSDPPWVSFVDTNINYNNVAAFNAKYNATVKWIQNTTNAPWLIGETGFTASAHPISDPHAQDYYLKNDGDVDAQAAYLLNAYTVCLQAGGMGTLWWEYKDYTWQYSTNPSGSYFGLVDSLQVIKPAGNTLAGFNSSAVSGAPPPYPSNFQNLDGNTGTQVSGNVGVPDAVITGLHRTLNPNTNGNYVNSVSDASGNFTITSQTPPPGYLPPTTAINVLNISAVGYGNIFCDATTIMDAGGCGKTFTMIPAASYNNSPASPVHYSSTNPIDTAPNNLTLQVLNLNAGGGTLLQQYIAGREIQILPNGSTDGYAQTGIEAAFYIGNADVAGTIDVDCGDVAWTTHYQERKSNTGNHIQVAGTNNQVAGNNPITVTNVKTVYLSAEGNFTTQVYPNPASDKIYINAGKSINFMVLYDGSGKEVYKNSIEQQGLQSIDVAGMAPGVYNLRITYTDNSISISQIVKQ